MKKFEVGNRYYESGLTFEITGRTEKTIKFVEVQHAGRFNERKSEEKKRKIFNWDTREVFFAGARTVEA